MKHYKQSDLINVIGGGGGNSVSIFIALPDTLFPTPNMIFASFIVNIYIYISCPM